MSSMIFADKITNNGTCMLLHDVFTHSTLPKLFLCTADIPRSLSIYPLIETLKLANFGNSTRDFTYI